MSRPSFSYVEKVVLLLKLAWIFESPFGGDSPRVEMDDEVEFETFGAMNRRKGDDPAGSREKEVKGGAEFAGGL